MLPDSIPESLWAEFRLHRKKLKAPMTDHAETLILCKLEKWRIENGANPIDVLNESIEKGWRGVFLNGHGNTSSSSGNSSPILGKGETPAVTSAKPLCCICGGSLEAGFIHTRGGRKCHNC